MRQATTPGRMRPRTSPSGSPRRTTSSPSSRKVRSLPSSSRTGSAPFQRQLDQAALAAALGAGDRPGGHQVARPDARPVRGRVRELLRHRPVEAARVAARDHGAVQLHLERHVERPVAPRRAGAAAARAPAVGGGDAAVLEQRERRHPRRDRGGEALAEERAERDVLPGLEVARAPVVDEHDAEDVVGEGACRDRLAERARRRRRRSRARARGRAAATGRTSGASASGGFAWPCGRRTGVPLTTTVPARPW